MTDVISEPSTVTQNSQTDESDPERPRSGFWARLFGGPPAQTPAKGSVEPRTHDVRDLSNLRSKRLDDVAIPRAEIVSVPIDIELRELMEVFRDSGLTRLPVYEGTLDQPVGMAHLKDIALALGFRGDVKDFDLKPLMRSLIYAPPSMPIGVMLQKMQTERIHMALVIDEYGGVDGLVTLEDLVEQVLGEIADEHDEQEGKLWREEKPGCYVALARAPLEEFEAETGLALSEGLDEEDIDTLGGLVFVLSGHVPVRGEMVQHPSGVEIEVIDADPRRIKRLRLRLPDVAGPAE